MVGWVLDATLSLTKPYWEMGLEILSGGEGHLERSYKAKISGRGRRLVHKSPKGKF